jgi:cytolysin-activating lysine-acyltransferase
MEDAAHPNDENPAGSATSAPSFDQGAIGRQLSANEVAFAVSFTRVISVLAKSPPYRNAPLIHIEQFIGPPLLSGQFAIADAPLDGHRVPMAVAFWALVSPEVDLQLSDVSKATALRPADWRSGDIPWLIDVVGQPEVSAQLTQELLRRVFPGREVKIRRLDAEGKLLISRLNSTEPTTPSEKTQP